MKDLMLRQYYFFPDFNSWSCELGNLTFKVLYWVVLYGIILKQNKFTILPQFLDEKSRTVSFAFSVMKTLLYLNFLLELDFLLN